MRKLITILTMFFIIGASTLKAEEAAQGEHAEHKESHESHAEHGHNNHVSIFAGATTFFEHGDTSFTAGLDYEFRLPFANRLFGIGALTDFSFGLETSGVFAGFIGIHPIGGLKVLVAPGIEAIFGEHPHTAFLLRGSLGYDIMIEKFSITPIVSLDYIPETSALSLVYGIAAGLGF